MGVIKRISRVRDSDTAGRGRGGVPQMPRPGLSHCCHQVDQLKLSELEAFMSMLPPFPIVSLLGTRVNTETLPVERNNSFSLFSLCLGNVWPCAKFCIVLAI